MPADDETRPLSAQEVNLTSNGDPDMDDGDESDPLLRPSLPRHSTVEHGPPADPWHISYWIMVIQGASMLLPWNVFITAQGFFHFRFAGSPYEDNFQNYFSVAFMGTNLLVVGSSILIQKQAPGTTHIIGSLLLNAFVFLAILVSIQMERAIDPTLYFFFAITMLSLSAISTSIVQNGMFGLASKFTGRHVQGVMVGQGLAGAGVAISQIVTQILSPPKGSSYTDEYLSISDLAELGGHRRRSEGLEHSAFMFFSFALGFTLVSVLAQALLIRLPIYDYYTSEQALQPIQFLAPPSPANGLAVPADSSDARRNSTSSMASAVTTVTITPAMIAETNRRLNEEAHEREEAERVNHYRSTSLGATALATDASALQLMHDIYPKKKAHPLLILYISITLVFALTLSLFPSLTALVKSTNEAPDRGRVFGDLFVPLHFLVYNVGDWAGKTLPSIAFFSPNTTHPTRKQQLRYLAGALSRLMFIPIFLTANLPIKPEGARLLPLLIRRDEIWFLLVFLFAITNGYLGSLIMMVGPACVLGGEKKGRAGVKLGFWLTAGLALGSVASFGVRELMCARGGCSA
ncbi:solute carrier family 29 (equilibrative nucleoside transporter), member 1/2/3 [Entomortierella parvispora]|uniref:Solute carrier family 29 (Equilibrative nucleoside transporter), member 1/2/3 n=1 Tax=Entomortierella parvispora TaxID=205924 RepID=A0A9P3LVS3_9FUNG|nr:solute carrier family 29 (equilibrative nucleoside transporter), member 1/2/3 [Entomortierella parvispora]